METPIKKLHRIIELTQEQKDRIEYLLFDKNATKEEVDKFFNDAVPPLKVDVSLFTKAQSDTIEHIFYTKADTRQQEFDDFVATLDYKQKAQFFKAWEAMKKHLVLYVDTNKAIFDYVDFLKKKHSNHIEVLEGGQHAN